MADVEGPVQKGAVIRRRLITMGSIAAVMLAIPAIAFALSDAKITSSGPLDEIIISDELNCQVSHVLDDGYEFYPPTVQIGACATQIRVGGVTYGPSNLPGAPAAVPFRPVSQSTVTGTGSFADPYQIVTVVDVGETGLRLTQTDSYIVGQESYRTDVVVDNRTDTTQEVILYRAGDCYLQESDFGFGAADPATGAVSCVGTSDLGITPGNRVIQWYPLTPGSAYMEDFYALVWDRIASGQPFPNTIADGFIDNGAGLSWSLSIPPMESRTVSELLVASPDGVQPLSVTKTADESRSTAGASNGYQIDIRNPGSSDVTLDSIVDVLPEGFSYVAGSTSGATTEDPTINGRELRWSGSHEVPAGDAASLSFDVVVASTPGTYFNQATATGSGLTIVPTGPTAAVIVEPVRQLTVTKTANATYDRTWVWSIDKIGDTTSVDLDPGEETSIGYEVTLDAAAADDNWAVDGTITIHNPTSLTVTIESIVDEVEGVGTIPVSCPGSLPQDLAPNTSLVCSYSGSLPDGETRVNRATVATGAGPVLGGTATADIVFGEPTSEQDTSALVTDTLAGSLGSVPVADVPATLKYGTAIGPFACGLTEVDNIATFETSDSATTGSSSWQVAVRVECGGSCTQGTGYWKNHSEYGPAPYDATWEKLPEGADTEFLASGDSWYDVFQTNPKGGNAWYQLAHPYMAARLNQLGGAAVPAEVVAALAEAEGLLTVHALDQAIPKKSPDRSLALQLAGVLGDYNAGRIGPGSC